MGYYLNYDGVIELPAGHLDETIDGIFNNMRKAAIEAARNPTYLREPLPDEERDRRGKEAADAFDKNWGKPENRLLVELMNEIFWSDMTTRGDGIVVEVEPRDDHDVVCLYITYYGKLHDDQTQFFDSVAPFALRGRIDCKGEEDNYWRIRFKDGQRFEYDGVITYPSDPDE